MRRTSRSSGALGFGLAAFVLLAGVQTSLDGNIALRVPNRAPDYFVLDLPQSKTAEFDRIVRLSGEKRDVELALLPATPEDTAPVGDEEIKAWYDAHPADFTRPESVTIEYVEVDGSRLPAPAPADEATLRKRYDEEKARFVEPEQRLASHILVRVDAGADAAALKAAEEKAQRLAEEAKAPGADFAALAKANSEDPGSRDSGGDLGWVERGAMVAPFEEALFAMQPGEVRGPVKTDFGFHVLQLRELKQGAQVPFEQAREELAREQAQADRERAFSDLTGRLTDLVYQNPSSLAPAAEQVGLPVQKLGPFTRDDTVGIGASPEVKKAAFSEAMIQDGTASDPIELGPEHSVVVRVLEHTPEQPRPLAEVRDQVIAAIRADRREKAAIAGKHKDVVKYCEMQKVDEKSNEQVALSCTLAVCQSGDADKAKAFAKGVMKSKPLYEQAIKTCMAAKVSL